jgi:hypothetical protein
VAVRRSSSGTRGWGTVPVVVVHLIDGTYELFRYFLSPAAAFDRSAPEAHKPFKPRLASGRRGTKHNDAAVVVD